MSLGVSKADVCALAPREPFVWIDIFDHGRRGEFSFAPRMTENV